jgi:hypothetical protein
VCSEDHAGYQCKLRNYFIICKLVGAAGWVEELSVAESRLRELVFWFGFGLDLVWDGVPNFPGKTMDRQTPAKIFKALFSGTSIGGPGYYPEMPNRIRVCVLLLSALA